MKRVNFMSVYRKRKNLAQWEMAQELDISQTDISNIETGKVLPSVFLREKISLLLEERENVIFPQEKSSSELLYGGTRPGMNNPLYWPKLKEEHEWKY